MEISRLLPRKRAEKFPERQQRSNKEGEEAKKNTKNELKKEKTFQDETGLKR